VSEVLATTLRTGELTAADRAFEIAIRFAAHATRAAYDKMLIREALKTGLCASLMTM
jgi:hypothetical protein